MQPPPNVAYPVVVPAAARGSEPQADVDVQPLMQATRVINAVIVRSLGTVDGSLTLPQLRCLVVLSSIGSSNLSGVAEALGVNPSNASRTCDQLVQRGLVDRKADPQDRRHVALRLSRAGRRLVREVMRHREQLLERIVAAMPSPDQVALMTAIESFNTAAQVVGEELLGDPLSGRPAVRWLG